MTLAEIEASLALAGEAKPGRWDADWIAYCDNARTALPRMAKALIAIDHYAEVLQAEGHKYTKIGDDLRRIIEEA